MLLQSVDQYIARLAGDIATLSPERRVLLGEVAAYVTNCREAGSPARLVFICTHNSRRSHLSQAWAAVAAHRAGLGGEVVSLSGGTEATAFNPRAVRALTEAGLHITPEDDTVNPRYRVEYAHDAPPLHMFSKRFDDDENTAGDFAAIMTCAEADRDCPWIPGARTRIALRYEDPKVADGTAREGAAYAERCRQIAAEMCWIFERVCGRV